MVTAAAGTVTSLARAKFAYSGPPVGLGMTRSWIQCLPFQIVESRPRARACLPGPAALAAGRDSDPPARVPAVTRAIRVRLGESLMMTHRRRRRPCSLAVRLALTVTAAAVLAAADSELRLGLSESESSLAALRLPATATRKS
jgi:hypothetical protein